MKKKSMQDHQEQRLMFKKETPLFYRIILDQSLCEGKLALPKRFVRGYGSDLPSSVLLKVPNGAGWPVELLKCNDDIWFAKGWQEFTDYYSLAHGHFLVFEYEKGYGFHVLVFDMSASEIHYPCCLTNNSLKELHVKYEVRKSGIEITEEDVVCCEVFNEYSQNGGDRLENIGRKVNSNCHGHQFKDVEDREGMTVLEEKLNRGMGVLAKMEPLIDALQKASPAFKPENPYFVVAMYPSYVLNDIVAIPESFASKYFGKAHGSVILCSLDGRTWPLEFSIWRSQGKSAARIHRGWKDFAQHYLLRVGDVCVFELMEATENTLKVLFFRGSPNANRSFSIGNSKWLRHNLFLCQEIAEKPDCLPSTRSRKRMKIDSTSEELGSSSKLQPLIPSNSSTHSYQYGRVMQENSMNERSPHQSEIQRVVGRAVSGNIHHSRKFATRMMTLTDNEKGDAAKRASTAFKSKNPFFVVAMHPSYFHPPHYVAIPVSFARKYLEEKYGNVVLSTSDGRTWLAKYSNTACKGYVRARMYGGWNKFAQDNFLQVGDVCVFELVDGSEISLKVVIFKAAE